MRAQVGLGGNREFACDAPPIVKRCQKWPSLLVWRPSLFGSLGGQVFCVFWSFHMRWLYSSATPGRRSEALRGCDELLRRSGDAWHCIERGENPKCENGHSSPKICRDTVKFVSMFKNNPPARFLYGTRTTGTRYLMVFVYSKTCPAF